MRLVAIRADDALGVHPALKERAVVVDLVAHLAVVVVQPLLQQREAMAVGERLAVHLVVGDARVKARIATAASQ